MPKVVNWLVHKQKPVASNPGRPDYYIYERIWDKDKMWLCKPVEWRSRYDEIQESQNLLIDDYINKNPLDLQEDELGLTAIEVLDKRLRDKELELKKQYEILLSEQKQKEKEKEEFEKWKIEKLTTPSAQT